MVRPSAWRLALRIARRDAWRAKGRSALILAMLALPVAGVAAADISYRTQQLTPAQELRATIGEADAVYDSAQVVMGVSGPVMQTPLADSYSGPYEGAPPEGWRQAPIEQVVPAGSLVTEVREGYDVSIRTEHGIDTVAVREADLAQPVARSTQELLDGRYPEQPTEAAASSQFLEDYGLDVGDTTVVAELDDREVRIVGTYEKPRDLNSVELLFTRGSVMDDLAAAAAEDPRRASSPVTTMWLVDAPDGGVDWESVLTANEGGYVVRSVQVFTSPPPDSEVPYYREYDAWEGGPGFSAETVLLASTVAGMALLQIVLLSGPAFAVGARRSQRMLGLFGAAGADRSHTRAVVLGGGIVLGVVGAVGGLLLGALLSVVTRPWLEEAGGARFGPWEFRPLELLAIAAVGLVTGVLAALVPAVLTARQDVMQALRGRVGVRRGSRRLPVIGAVAVAAGTALALGGTAAGQGEVALLLGSAIAELGLIAIVPAVIGALGRLGRRLPLSPRLALRDAVRNRPRTTPAVAAVMAAVAGSVALAVYTVSDEAYQEQEYTPALRDGMVLGGATYDEEALAATRAAVERAMPVTDRALLLRPVATTEGGEWEMDSWVDVQLPEENHCPFYSESVPDPEQLSEAELAELRADPRCAEESTLYGGSTYSFAGGGALVAVDPAELAVVLGRDDQDARAALEAGKAVVLDELLLTAESTVEIVVNTPEDWERYETDPEWSPEPRTLDAVPVDASQVINGARVLIAPETAASVGLTAFPDVYVWQTERMPTDEEEQAAMGLLDQSTAENSSTIAVERGFEPDNGVTLLLLTAFAGVVTVGAAGIATGLASADSQRDLATLAAVGARPRVRRALSGFQCGLIALIGAVLGAGAGLVPGVGVIWAREYTANNSYPTLFPDNYPVEVPWWHLAAVVTAVPLLALVLAAVFTRSRLAARQRTD
ncbi:FtsX-like permease family protein [Allostreptomyces psammosilenae]|uniref:Putative ABC transport system permease protein n=1 Tax=Allostreptomyces psammosilenae TaxID=1892865 RepID=A0A853AD83_9ACTN|nr:FtsX-like permease family protein [Allostreptomyces psammosilenae]NYI08292.1 putative ABC transport system permease protein [Allostreptomyces psammosilenae]